MAKNGNDKSVVCENVSFAAKEAYKKVRTGILFSFTDDGKSRVIGVTSSVPGEGKSITSVNLAYSFAQIGKKVLLVEGDMRRPSIHNYLSMTGSPGLSNMLTGINSTGGRLVSMYKPSDDTEGIYFLPAGDLPPNPAELFNSDKMTDFVSMSRQKFDIIIIDLPPVNAVADVAILSNLLDGFVVVVHENVTRHEDAAKCFEELNRVNAKILGVIMNGVDLSKDSHYGRYGKYGYNYYKYGYYK